MSHAWSAWILLIGLGQIAEKPPAKSTKPQTPPASQSDWLKVLTAKDGYSCMGQFLAGKRFGFEIENEGPVLWNGRLAWRIAEESVREELVEGKPARITTRTTSIHALLEDGPLVYYHQITDDNGKRTEKIAKPEGQGQTMRLQVNRDGRLDSRLIDRPKASLAQTVAMDSWLASRPEPGTQMTSWETEWEGDQLDKPSTYTLLGREQVGQSTASRLRCEMEGAHLECLISDHGKTLSARMGPLVLRQEPETQARQVQPGLVDLADALSVPLEGLRDPRGVNRFAKAVWLLDGMQETPFTFPTDDRQRVQPGIASQPGTLRLVTTLEPASLKPQPLADDARAAMLAATPTLQVNNPRLKAWALRQVGVAKNPSDKAALLAAAVYRHLGKTMAANAEDAVSVLDQAKGDCTEHSLLFVATARACGVPAREVTGLVPGEATGKNLGKTIMMWHAWAEYHDGNAWRGVDPTWNQVHGVDATHIKLTIGPNDWSWMNLLGSLRVKLEESSLR